MAEEPTSDHPAGISQQTEWLIIGIGSLLFTLGFYFTAPSLWESMDYVFFYRPNFHFLHDAIWSGTLLENIRLHIS